MFDPVPFPMVLLVLTGWLERQEREVIAYLFEETHHSGKVGIGPLGGPIVPPARSCPFAPLR